MKINWKIVLVFVLILALLGPVYSKAIETEQSTSLEQPVEPVVEEAIKETPEKKETETEPEPSKTEEIETKKPSTEPSKLKANPSSIPENSTIADLFPDPVMAESVVTNLNNQIRYKNDWVVTDVITQKDLDNLSSFTDLSTVIIKNLEGIQYMTNLNRISLRSDDDLQGLSALLKAPNGYPNLQEITILRGGITDISPILKINAPKLAFLNLSQNKISDLSPFANLPNNFPVLEEIILASNNISNVEPLAKYASASMRFLLLNSNSISDLSSFKNNSMPKLVEIVCTYQQVYLEPMDLSAKYDFTLKAAEAKGVNKSIPITVFDPIATIDNTTSMITWKQNVIEKKPEIFLKEGGFQEGVKYG